jgi:hypothetical protein
MLQECFNLSQLPSPGKGLVSMLSQLRKIVSFEVTKIGGTSLPRGVYFHTDFLFKKPKIDQKCLNLTTNGICVQFCNIFFFSRKRTARLPLVNGSYFKVA